MRVEDIDGIRELWAHTLGDPRVRIAILDGPVDVAHDCFRGSALTQLALGIGTSELSQTQPARLHGTHIASLILASHNGEMRGASPNCSGILGTIFNDFDPSGRICSSEVLAFAINKSLDAGANVINISSGSLVDEGMKLPVLEAALKKCEDRNVLVVAATGNDGCQCDHLPALYKTVLAVGAGDAEGRPADFTNWGKASSAHGIIAPGMNIIGAQPTGGYRKASGTSQATAIVSGIAGLLMSLQWQSTGKVDGITIRETLLQSTKLCTSVDPSERARCMVGHLDVVAAMGKILKRREIMAVVSSEVLTNSTPENAPINSDIGSSDRPTHSKANFASSSLGSVAIEMSDCGCGCTSGKCTCATTVVASTKPAYVFPIGQIGYDYSSRTARDSLRVVERLPNPDNKRELVSFLEDEKFKDRAEELVWTLEVDGEPLYAIAPVGAYAEETYKRLVEFLRDQEIGVLVERAPPPPRRGRRQADEENLEETPQLIHAEYCAIPGTIVGRAHLYLAGKDVDVIKPSLRGMANWQLGSLVNEVTRELPTLAVGATPPGQEEALNFLRTLFSLLRNDGRAPEDRARNFIAINFAEMLVIFGREVAKGMSLESIDVRPSQIRPDGTDRWDVILSFFKPTDQLGTAVTEYPITVDVDYVNPVIVRVGPPRRRSMRVVKPYI